MGVGSDEMTDTIPNDGEASRTNPKSGSSHNINGHTKIDNWKFAQCFGDKTDTIKVNDGDIISTVEFDHTGDYLASGDRAGRVVLFQRTQSKRSCVYKFYAEFQSHEPEFDYLKSLEINERINKISWCKRVNDAHFLLSTNDKTIKLWKVKERSVQAVIENNMSISKKLAHTDVRLPLSLPKTVMREPVVTAVPRLIYSNAHTYNINSISLAADGEMFLSADDLRINMWDLNNNSQSFNLVDIKPVSLEDLNEVITCATFHPLHGHLFAYSTSKGSVRLGDMRESALCDTSSKHYPSNHGNFDNVGGGSGRSSKDVNCFGEIVSSISDVKFSQCGRYFVTRDYLTIQIWDVNMERQPVYTQAIHPVVQPRLCDLYDSDIIFDKFECGFTYDGRSILTGSYSNYLRICPSGINPAALQPTSPGYRGKGEVVQANKSIFKSKKLSKSSSLVISPNLSAGTLSAPNSIAKQPHQLDIIGGSNGGGGSSSSASDGSIDGNNDALASDPKLGSNTNNNSIFGSEENGITSHGGDLDYDRKILHLSVHPCENTVALASLTNLFIFSTV